MRCEHCGVEQRAVLGTTKTHCAPPFIVQRHAFTGKHPADIREADANGVFIKANPAQVAEVARHGGFTDGLGPVKFDPNADSERAKIVREALIATNSHLLTIAARYCSDATLCHLRRLLKT